MYPGEQTQTVILVDPVAVVVLPTKQFEHVLIDEAPLTLEYLPLTQLVQPFEFAYVAPVRLDHLPAPQFIQRAVPIAGLNFPGTHWQQVLPAPEVSQSVRPAGHE